MEKYTFFNDENDDRVAYAEDFARHLAQYFTNGIFNNGCQVNENNSMNVIVSEGSANINGYRYDNMSNKILIIENADGVLSRIDNIVIRLDLVNRMITAQVIKGEFSNEPIEPDLVRTSTIYDLRIAKVSIPAGTTTITQDLITDTRFLSNDCGNVVSTVNTPDTEDIFIQYQKVFEDTLKIFFNDFSSWFENVQELFGNTDLGEVNKKLENLNDFKADDLIIEDDKLQLTANNEKIGDGIENLLQFEVIEEWDEAKTLNEINEKEE